MTTPIDHYSDLLAAIEDLPETPPGHVRVFRGQTKDYPRILPSGLRRPLRKEAIWGAYAQHLYHDLAPHAFADGQVTVEALMAAGLWLKAVAQHYGPGSNFVDVTHSVEVGLWFALHSIEEVIAEGLIGPEGPPDPERDHPTYSSMNQYVPWQEVGYLYIWDLPPWDSEQIAQPGVVVDLAEAPKVFSDSPRMRAQQGCLIYCGEDAAKALDLRAHLVPGTPLRVRRPMTGSRGLQRTVAEMFPSPAVDPWYERLLSVPMMYAPSPPPPRLQRSIPVGVYFDPDDPAYMREVVYRDVALGRPLLHRSLTSSEMPVTLVLEAPLIFPYPPGDSDQWHHELLETDLPQECPIYELGGRDPAGRASLTNVLFEFSLLEYTGWERVVREHADIYMFRGIWLRRRPDGFYAAFLHHGIHDQDVEIVGFLPVRLDPTSRQWVFQAHDGSGEAVPITGEPAMAKRFLVALMLLRHLSSELKVDAVPQMETRSGTTRKLLVKFARDAARLHRVPSPVHEWYVLRSATEPEEPFTHVNAPLGALSLTTEVPFRDVAAHHLREHLRATRVPEPDR